MKCPKHPEFRAETCYYCIGESEMKPKTIADYLDAVYSRRMTIAEARQSLFDLFMSCVPEERFDIEGETCFDHSSYLTCGFNEARKEIIKNINALK